LFLTLKKKWGYQYSSLIFLPILPKIFFKKEENKRAISWAGKWGIGGRKRNDNFPVFLLLLKLLLLLFWNPPKIAHRSSKNNKKKWTIN